MASGLACPEGVPIPEEVPRWPKSSLAAVAAVLAAAGAACEGERAAADAGLPDAVAEVCPAPATYELKWFTCLENPESCADPLPGLDDDRDGASDLQGDCDDTDPFVGPRAREVCDLADNDCDGEVDEGGVCPDPAVVCPLSYADVRCCGARATIAGSFHEEPPDEAGDAGPRATAGFATPWAVMVRRRDTGERRQAVVCPAPPEADGGFPFRFVLEDESFVVADAPYEVVVHLRWYLPSALGRGAACYRRVPVLVPDPVSRTACLELGALRPWCL